MIESKSLEENPKEIRRVERPRQRKEKVRSVSSRESRSIGAPNATIGPRPTEQTNMVTRNPLRTKPTLLYVKSALITIPCASRQLAPQRLNGAPQPKKNETRRPSLDRASCKLCQA